MIDYTVTSRIAPNCSISESTQDELNYIVNVFIRGIEEKIDDSFFTQQQTTTTTANKRSYFDIEDQRLFHNVCKKLSEGMNGIWDGIHVKRKGNMIKGIIRFLHLFIFPSLRFETKFDSISREKLRFISNFADNLQSDQIDDLFSNLNI